MIEAHQSRNEAEVESRTRFDADLRIEYRTDGDVRTFQKTPTIPTPKDLSERTPLLKPNVVNGPYPDVREYLGTQFHLLREDFVAPLRSGIQMFRRLHHDGHKMHRGTLQAIEGVDFYEGIRFDSPKSHGLPASVSAVRLSRADYARVDWDSTARLMHGSLLGFSKDHFREVIFAVVSKKQTPSLLKKGVLVVEFVGTCKRSVSPGKYLIIENSRAYFEAYRHNLKALQLMDPDCFPLQRYLVRAERSVRAPCFHEPNRPLNFEPILKHKLLMPKLSSEWPPPAQTLLNDQQYEAVKSAFDRELCLIQGPPGTGKTFVALRIVEMLLLNRVSDRPILVVCYTNHALDQFLEGMLQYTENLVRLGGCSRSEKLKEFTITKLSRDGKLMKQLRDDREACARRLKQLSEQASDDEATLSVEYLVESLTANLASVQRLEEEGTAPREPRRDANVFRDPYRRRINRSVVHNYSKGPLSDEPTRAQKSRARYVSWKQSARNTARNDLIRKASASLTARIADIDDAIKELQKKPPSWLSRKDKKQILESIRIVGSTTTGAAKYGSLLRQIKPEIVIVEEAAEVLESHLLASFLPSTKQLILIGDHQQLQPRTAVHRLAEEFGMGVSLFERLVRNGVDFVKLRMQHRMRDEFLCLLVPHIYENYYSHRDVDNYPQVRGVASNLFFMTHSSEELHDPKTHSHANVFEAGFVVGLAYHFLQSGYDRTEITILATYRGQVATIERDITEFCKQKGFSEMKDIESVQRGPNGKQERFISRVPIDPSLPESPFEGMRITTVDDYQGEENKIVIVSFVRSNNKAKIGFLAKENRVCVALSRAKHGLFCVGDVFTLASASVLWAELFQTLWRESKIGSAMTLLCKTQRHQRMVRTKKDFDGWFVRGCEEICGEDLPCGHLCNKECHASDTKHRESFRCDRICGKFHPCGHICVKVCREDCGPCEASTTKTLDCGHTVDVKCSERSLCEVMTEWTPSCGHSRMIPCGLMKAANLLCGMPVRLIRPCGHTLRASCNAVAIDEACLACEAQSQRNRRTLASLFADWSPLLSR